MHAHGGRGRQIPQLCQVGLKVDRGTAGIAVADRQVFIMVPDFAARAGDLSDNRLVPAFRHGPETAGCRNARIMLQPGGFQNIARPPVHVVAEDDDPFGLTPSLISGAQGKSFPFDIKKKRGGGKPDLFQGKRMHLQSGVMKIASFRDVNSIPVLFLHLPRDGERNNQ